MLYITSPDKLFYNWKLVPLIPLTHFLQAPSFTYRNHQFVLSMSLVFVYFFVFLKIPNYKWNHMVFVFLTYFI